MGLICTGTTWVGRYCLCRVARPLSHWHGIGNIGLPTPHWETSEDLRVLTVLYAEIIPFTCLPLRHPHLPLMLAATALLLPPPGVPGPLMTLWGCDTNFF